MVEIRFVERSLKRLQGYELNSRALRGLQDVNGKWHVGAIATLIDNAGGAAIYTISGLVKVTTNFKISYYSTAKIQEEVDIEAKVIGNEGKLTSVVVEIRKEANAELVAIGSQWMASNDYREPQPKL